jgi:hypothetical protein
MDALSPFIYLDKDTAFRLFKDMYVAQDGGYHFNFSLLSKHAMSRIYEKVVAERLVAHLERSGCVIMRKPIPNDGAGDNPGRRGFEG